MLTEQNEKGGQSLFSCNITAVKHKHLNRSVCFNRNHSMKTQTRNKVSLDSGWLRVLLRSYLAERRSAVALLGRMNCLFFPSLPRMGSFMFPVVMLGRRTHYQETLQFLQPLLKTAFSFRSSFCLLSQQRYYK